MSSLTKRIDNPVPHTNFLKANLLAAINLVLMFAHKSFSLTDNEVLLNKILQNSGCFSVDYASKLLIISLSELLVKVD